MEIGSKDIKESVDYSGHQGNKRDQEKSQALQSHGSGSGISNTH